MIIGNLDCIHGRAVAGWAWNPQDPGARILVRVLVDGLDVCSGLAERYRPDLHDAGIGDGAHSYSFDLPDHVMDGSTHEIAALFPDGRHLAGSPLTHHLPSLRFEPLPRDPIPYPHELAICAIAKNEARYLLEWIAYHRTVGVDRFLIYDNESNDSTSELLSRPALAAFVERIPWPSTPGIPPQLSAYRDGAVRLRSVARWTAFIDLDEFIVPLQADDLRTVLTEYRFAGGLVVPWRTFGSGGATHYSDDLVIRRFRHRAADDHPANSSVKTIVQGRAILDVGVHVPTLRQGCLVDEHFAVAGSQGDPNHHRPASVGRITLHHYFCKSWEEWTWKRDRGRADRSPEEGGATHIRDDSHFHAHDVNSVEDTTMERFELPVRHLLGSF